jgi:hypothetical protein
MTGRSGNRCLMIFGNNEIQIDIVLERAAATDHVRLGRGDLAYREERHAIVVGIGLTVKRQLPSSTESAR